MNSIQELINKRDAETDLAKQAKIQEEIDILFERETAKIQIRDDSNSYWRLMASLG